MVRVINKKLIYLIYTREVAKQVYMNSLNIHMGSSSKIQEVAMSKNRRNMFTKETLRGQCITFLVEPVSILISLIQNSDTCLDATQAVHISKPKLVVNISMSSFRHLQKR